MEPVTSDVISNELDNACDVIFRPFFLVNSLPREGVPDLLAVWFPFVNQCKERLDSIHAEHGKSRITGVDNVIDIDKSFGWALHDVHREGWLLCEQRSFDRHRSVKAGPRDAEQTGAPIYELDVATGNLFEDFFGNNVSPHFDGAPCHIDRISNRRH